MNQSSKRFSLGISGEVHGAGSSTTAKLISQLLGFDYCYAGLHYRRKAVEKGFAKNLDDGNGVAVFATDFVANHPEIDVEIDHKIINQAAQGGCVFEGKAVVVLAKAGKQPLLEVRGKKYSLGSLKSAKPFFAALLTCDEAIASQRVLVRKKLLQQNKNPLTASKKEREKIIKQLTDKDIKRQIKESAERIRVTRANWNKFYGLSKLEKIKGIFDLTIDTSHLTIKQVIAVIVAWLVENPDTSPFLSEEVKQRISAEFPEI